MCISLVFFDMWITSCWENILARCVSSLQGPHSAWPIKKFFLDYFHRGQFYKALMPKFIVQKANHWWWFYGSFQKSTSGFGAKPMPNFFPIFFTVLLYFPSLSSLPYTKVTPSLSPMLLPIGIGICVNSASMMCGWY